MDEEKDEWDGPWKEALDCLDLVFALFWPDVLKEADLEKGWEPLQQELQKLTSDASTGLLRVDKLFEVFVRQSGDPRLAHFEAQMQFDKELPLRMFRYGYRGRDHFNQPVGSFAIFGDDDPAWKPTEHREGVFGCEQTTKFRIAKLIEWRERMGELEAGENLFGLFVCAHLETMRTRGDVPERQEAKFRLLANLLRREIPLTDLNLWYRLIDWIMKLDTDANRTVWLRLEALKEPKTVAHITFAEIYGREKGLEEGIKEGRSEGIKEGRTEGIKEGRTEGIKEALREALLEKFPADGATLFDELKGDPSLDRLKLALRMAVVAESPADFRSRIAAST